MSILLSLAPVLLPRCWLESGRSSTIRKSALFETIFGASLHETGIPGGNVNTVP